MSKVIHQYFNRRYSEWDITDFLQECELEDLGDKISVYVKSLKIIADANKGQRGNKAKELLARYREAEKSSELVNKFWMVVNEKLINIKIKNEENKYDLTLTTNVNKQMGAYVNTITSHLTKRFLDCAKESPSKCVTKNLNSTENDPNNSFIVSEIINEDNLNKLFTTPDGSNSDKSYNPSLDGPDDDSFISMKNRKINHTYDWFTGLGVMEFSLSEGAKKWVIDTLNVSSLLLEYRDISVQQASENKIEEVAETLSLNHIFLFEENILTGIPEMNEPNQ
nr:6989_t:CDS:2 [Entrophospora candida]